MQLGFKAKYLMMSVLRTIESYDVFNYRNTKEV